MPEFWEKGRVVESAAPFWEAGGKPVEQPSTGELAKSAALSGAANLISTPWDAYNLLLTGQNWLTDKANAAFGTTIPKAPLLTAGTSESMKGHMRDWGILTAEPTAETPTIQRLLYRMIEGGISGFPLGGVKPVQMAATALSGAAGGAGAEAGHQLYPDSQIAEILGAGAGALSGNVLGNLTAKTEQAVLGGGGKNIREYKAEGVTPRLAGDVSSSSFAKLAQGAARDLPGASGRIRAAAQETIKEVENAVERRAATVGPWSGPTEAGAAVRTSADDWVNQFKTDSDRRWNALYRSVPQPTPVTVTNTQGALTNLTQSMPGAPSVAKVLTSPLMKNLDDALKADAASGVIPFKTLMRFRMEIGAKLSGGEVLDDVTRGELKMLYGALTEDIKAAAANHNALDVFNEANNFTRNGHRFAEDYLTGIKNKVDPEQVFKWATSGDKEGASKLFALEHEMGTLAIKPIAAAVLRGMGRTAPDAPFSPAKYFTDWSKLSKDAKAVLFRRDPGLSEAMDRLANITQGMRETGNIANSSRTAGTSMMMGILTGGSGAGGFALGLPAGFPVAAASAAAGLAAPIVAANLSSRLLTNPAFVKWLATPVSETGVPSHLRRLAAVAVSNPEIRSDIEAFIQAMAAGEPSSN